MCGGGLVIIMNWKKCTTNTHVAHPLLLIIVEKQLYTAAESIAVNFTSGYVPEWWNSVGCRHSGTTCTWLAANADDEEKLDESWGRFRLWCSRTDSDSATTSTWSVPRRRRHLGRHSSERQVLIVNYFACRSGCEVLWWARMCVCLYVCLSARISPEPHARSLSNFCALCLCTCRSYVHTPRDIPRTAHL